MCLVYAAQNPHEYLAYIELISLLLCASTMEVGSLSCCKLNYCTLQTNVVDACKACMDQPKVLSLAQTLYEVKIIICVGKKKYSMNISIFYNAHIIKMLLSRDWWKVFAGDYGDFSPRAEWENVLFFSLALKGLSDLMFLMHCAISNSFCYLSLLMLIIESRRNPYANKCFLLHWHSWSSDVLYIIKHTSSLHTQFNHLDSITKLRLS